MARIVISSVTEILCLAYVFQNIRCILIYPYKYIVNLMPHILLSNYMQPHNHSGIVINKNHLLKTTHRLFFQ